MQQFRSKSPGAHLCSLCHDTVKNSELLPCQHTFCNKCVNDEFAKRDKFRGSHDTWTTIMCQYCKDFFSTFGNPRNAIYHDESIKSQPDYRRDAIRPKSETRKSERCQPCKEGGAYSNASHWCNTCSEYFCSVCAKYHQSMKMSKSHTILQASEVNIAYGGMRRSHTVIGQEAVHKCDPCKQRKKTKNAKLWCQTCSEKFCDDCAQCHRSMKMSKRHNMTAMVEPRSRTDIFGAELKCPAHYGESLSLFCKRCKISCCTLCAITQHCKCGGGTKTDMSASLDRVARPLERDSSMVEYEYGGYGYDDRGRKQTRFDLGNNGMNSYNDGSCRDSIMKRTRSKSPFKQIAKLRMENRKARINFGGTYKGDWVISMAELGNGDILVIELYQSDLKRISSTGTLLATCNFHSDADPWSVALVDDRLAAVTFSDRNQIQLVNVKSKSLESGKRFTTKHKCLGICASNRYLVTTCWEGCVHVLSLAGSEMYCINKDNRGVRLFNNPEYIASNYAENEIYISDFKRGTVTALRIDGYRIDSNPKFIYSDSELRGPKGVSVDAEGVIYVSGMTSRNIHRVSPRGQRVQVFKRREDTDYYEAMCVSPSADRMLVSAHEDNTILVFRLSYK